MRLEVMLKDDILIGEVKKLGEVIRYINNLGIDSSSVYQEGKCSIIRRNSIMFTEYQDFERLYKTVISK